MPARHAVDRLWRAVESREQSSRSPTRSGEPVPEAPPPSEPAHTLLVWRRGVTVYHRPLEPLEAGALALVRAGTRFGTLCAELGREADAAQAARRAAALLGQWVADELLAAPP